jgi:hypothetical protein
LPNGDVLLTDDYNDRVIVVDPRSDRIVWQYGHNGVAGSGPGYLNNPDGLARCSSHTPRRCAGDRTHGLQVRSAGGRSAGRGPGVGRCLVCEQSVRPDDPGLASDAVSPGESCFPEGRAAHRVPHTGTYARAGEDEESFVLADVYLVAGYAECRRIDRRPLLEQPPRPLHAVETERNCNRETVVVLGLPFGELDEEAGDLG